MDFTSAVVFEIRDILEEYRETYAEIKNTKPQDILDNYNRYPIEIINIGVDLDVSVTQPIVSEVPAIYLGYGNVRHQVPDLVASNPIEKKIFTVILSTIVASSGKADDQKKVKASGDMRQLIKGIAKGLINFAHGEVYVERAYINKSTTDAGVVSGFQRTIHELDVEFYEE